MKTFALLTCAASVLLATTTWANIITSESNLEDLVKGKGPGTTATVNLNGASDTVTIYTTPAAGTFYVTQLCGSQVSGGVVLGVTGFGNVAQTGAEPCVSFNPGVFVPRNTAITCSTTPAAAPGTVYFCTITGFTGKK